MQPALLGSHDQFQPIVALRTVARFIPGPWTLLYEYLQTFWHSLDKILMFPCTATMMLKVIPS